MAEKVLQRGVNINAVNRNRQTPLLKAAAKYRTFPFLIAERWNQRISTGQLTGTKFDFFCFDEIEGKNLLHYTCETNSIGTTNIVLNQSPYLVLDPDYNLRIPIEYKNKAYLISWKLMFSMFKLMYLLALHKARDPMELKRPELPPWMSPSAAVPAATMISNFLNRPLPLSAPIRMPDLKLNQAYSFAPGKKEQLNQMYYSGRDWMDHLSPEYLKTQETQVIQTREFASLQSSWHIFEASVHNLYNPENGLGPVLEVRFGDNQRLLQVYRCLQVFTLKLTYLLRACKKGAKNKLGNSQSLQDHLVQTYQEPLQKNLWKLLRFVMENFSAMSLALISRIFDIARECITVCGVELIRNTTFDLLQTKNFHHMAGELAKPHLVALNLASKEIVRGGTV